MTMDSPKLTPATLPRPPAGAQTPPAEQQPLAPYTFPTHNLKRTLSSPDKIPLVLVACGSFSPITLLHTQMFKMAEAYVHHEKEFEIVGNYLSPVSDAYKKTGLAPAQHRVEMCAIAAGNSEIMVDTWETLRCNNSGEPEYTRTADVLRHVDYEINDVHGGITTPEGKIKRARIVLLVGADVAMTMGDPTVWAPSDLDIILGEYGAFIVEREGTDTKQALEPLAQYDKLWVVSSYPNSISSTKVRNYLRNGKSVRDIIPEEVFEYIKANDLYQADPH